MTIEIKKGNLLSSNAPVIAHQVNCCGVMGAGVAKAIKAKYAPAFYEYKEFCAVHSHNPEILMGLVHVAEINGLVRIANLFAQAGFGVGRLQTSYPALSTCFSRLLDYLAQTSLMRFAIPYRIGCGLAGGDWKTVFSSLVAVFKESDVTVEIWQLNPDNNLFGENTEVVVDRLCDGILTGEVNGVRFTAPADLLCPCKEGDSLRYTGEEWVVDSKATEERAENISQLWSGLNFQ